MRLIKFLPLIILSFSSVIFANREVLKERLASPGGALLEVHGSVEDQSLIVLTMRSPNNFFVFEHYSAFGVTEQLHSQLLNLTRHDKILVWGEIVENRSQQGHIEVSSFVVQTAYNNPHNPDEYDYAGSLPEELKNKNVSEFLVHAIHKNGEILVLEYKDRIVPVFVKPELAHHTKNLARNDLVRIHFEVARHPEAPLHLRLSSTQTNPVEVIEGVMGLHGKPADVTGYLVLFPQSPQVLFDVYAIWETLDYGLRRQYTLINFEDSELFKQIREKCAAAWATSPYDYINGRNKLAHKTIRFRAKGHFNQVDANQANVQIVIDNINDLEWVQD